MPAFLEKLIKRSLGDIPVITLDEGDKGDLQILCRKRHVLTVRDGTLNDNLQELINEAESSSSTLVVCNHVRTAQETFKTLRNHFGNDVVLLHGRFHQEDRNSIEAQLLRLPLPKVVVATQVIEVSLDVDFARGFIEPAPIDALVQRMGRINRAGRRAKPSQVTVFTEQVHSYQLYCKCPRNFHTPDCRVRQSIDALRRVKNPISERDLGDAADRVYANGYLGEDQKTFEEGLNHPDLVDFETQLLAGAHRDWVEQVIERADNTIEVLPKSLAGKYEKRKQQGLWIEANSLLVNIRSQSSSYLGEKLDTSTDPWTINAPYSSPPDGLGLEL